MKSHHNKWLVVNPHVVLTKHIDEVIFELDSHFAKAQLVSQVTSGLRDANSQLRIIRNAITRRGLAELYPDAFGEVNERMQWEGREVFVWQPGWSALLNIGFVVNPPLPAEVLMNYYRPGSTVNSKGKIIQASPHFKGLAFDVGGGPNGLNDEVAVVEGSKVKGIKGWLRERENNCLHVDVNEI